MKNLLPEPRCVDKSLHNSNSKLSPGIGYLIGGVALVALSAAINVRHAVGHTTDKLDMVLTGCLTEAMKFVEIKRKNREAWEYRNTERGKAAAAAGRILTMEVRQARREAWEAWRERREFARRQAKRGLYVLPLHAPESPGSRSCPACGVRQPATAYVDACDTCSTCVPQVDGLVRALNSLHAARARARSKVSFGDLGPELPKNLRAEIARTSPAKY